MKKIICILASLLVMGTASFAQTKPTATPVKKAPQTMQAKTAEANAAKAKMGAKPVDAKSMPKVKKDGTPDMRVKANKATAKPAAGPVKKDGTPDMRYKANKATQPPVKK